MSGCPLPIRGDFDHDGDVGTDDRNAFAACAAGAAVAVEAGCADKDFDGDQDVDLVDFGAFQRCWSGDDQPGNPACAP